MVFPTLMPAQGQSLHPLAGMGRLEPSQHHLQQQIQEHRLMVEERPRLWTHLSGLRQHVDI